jgi:hypothetical protein
MRWVGDIKGGFRLYVLPILSLVIFLVAVVMFLIFKFRRDVYVRL